MTKAFALLTLFICFFSHSAYSKIGVAADNYQAVFSHKV